jgi:hypothetical protein
MSVWMDNIGTASFRRARTVIVNQSPFNGETYRSGLGDMRWQFRFDYQTMTRAQAAPLLAAIAAQEEGTGSFEVYDPDFGVPMSGYVTSGLVNGAGQTGKVINTDGWVASALLGKAGDRAFIQHATGYHMHVLTADATANGSGQCALNLDTPFRGSPPDNGNVGFAPAIISAFRVISRLVSYDVQTQPGGLFSISVTGEEIV